MNLQEFDKIKELEKENSELRKENELLKIKNINLKKEKEILRMNFDENLIGWQSLLNMR